MAGLKRLGLAHDVTEIFEDDRFLPAPGQGAILIQIRDCHDPDLQELLHEINHKPSAARVAAERSFLKRLGGGCQLPCGIWTRLDEKQIVAGAALFSVDGAESAHAEMSGESESPEAFGLRLAEKLLENGGAAVLEKLRRA
jgi:hydroxymethylbilane synthase